MSSAWWGPLVVEAVDEAIEAGLLLQQVFGRGLGGFLLEREVHALVSTVLLRVAGLDALDLDAQAQPPHRELAQAEERLGHEKGTPLSVRIALGSRSP
jgi:hypothetical protein